MDSIQSDHQSTAGIADDVIETIQCAAINLSAAIMDCLSTALSSAKNRSGSSPSLSSTQFPLSVHADSLVLLKTFTEKPDLVNARLKVKEAVESYNTAAIHLTTAVLLQNKREERKKDVLEWIWEGEFDSEEKHKLLVENHIPETGKWFLESNEVQGWQGMTEDSASMIICSGIGITHLTAITNLSWRRKDVYNVSAGIVYSDNLVQLLLKKSRGWQNHLISEWHIFISIIEIIANEQQTLCAAS